MSNTITMTPERWQKLQSLYEAALTREGQERADFIIDSCGDDRSLREQLLSLVMASGNDEQFEQHVGVALAERQQRDSELKPGDLVGRYSIVRLLGRGGMGAVYLANRADREFEHQVAVKVVADDALSNRIVARLRTERQILANLNHPNIARLLDGGATFAGAPYLVMEFVDGVRIDRFCRERSLSIAERLALFRQLCVGVQYAHQQLIVHRDIKPGNILVTGEGVPKLLDFGIAKLVDPNLTSQTPALTRLHERVMTPENASPEQIRGEQVGTTTDVYALGGLLYELLSGLRPVNSSGLSMEQLERLILEVDPPKPSEALSQAIAMGHAPVSEIFAKQLRGDLDTIVMKAMHKDASRRYASAGALADDIGNYLANRPIAAQPDSLAYRTRKFVRRNRWSLAMAATTVSAVIALTAFYTWRLAVERDNAAVEAEKSKEVTQFLVGLFDASNPAQSQGRKITAVELLDEGAKRFDGELKGDPRVRSDVAYAIGESYKGLGIYDRAESMLDTAMADMRSAGKTDDPKFGVMLLEQANVKRFRGDLPGAESLFRQALAAFKQSYGDTHPNIARTYTNLGSLYYEHGRHRESYELQQQALAMTLALYGENHAETADRLNNLALSLRALGDYAKAKETMQRALDIRMQTLGPDHPNTMIAQYNFALAEQSLGNAAEGAGILRDTLARRKAILGARHPSIGFHLSALGSSLTTLGQYADAEHALDEARSIIGEQLGTQHGRYSAVLNNLAVLYVLTGRSALALEPALAGRAIDANVFGEDSEETLKADALVARVYREMDRARESREILTRIVARKDEKMSSRGAMNDVLIEIGMLSLETGEIDKAGRALGEALASLEKANPASPALLRPLSGLIRVALIGRDPKGAQVLIERAESRLQKVSSDTDWRRLELNALHGIAMSMSGEAERGKSEFDRALGQLRADPFNRDRLVRDLVRIFDLTVAASGRPSIAR